MRVGVDASFYFRAQSGIHVFTRNLVAELARRWDLCVYTSLPADFAAFGVRTRVVPGWNRDSRARLLWATLFLPQLIRRDSVDVLISPFSELPLRIPIPTISVVHDLIPIVMPGCYSWWFRQTFRLMLASLRRASIIVVPSVKTRADLLGKKFAHGCPIVVVPEGTRYRVNPDRCPVERLVGADRRPYLLYVGGFNVRKRVPLLLEAMEECLRDLPHRLVLVGWGDRAELRRVRSLVSRSRLRDRIVLLSQLSDSDLAALYTHADLFVFPSAYEGFGLPVLEAMACGTPVLCSDAASIPEVGGDAVRYFASGSLTALRAGIRDLLADPAAFLDLGRRGRVRAMEFTWQRTAEAYSQLITGLIQG